MKHLFYGAAVASVCGLFGGAALKMERASAAPAAVIQPLEPVSTDAEMDSTGSYYLSPPVLPINGGQDRTAMDNFTDPAGQLLKRAAFDVDQVYAEPAPAALIDPADPIPSATGMTTPAVRPDPASQQPPAETERPYRTIDDVVAAVSDGPNPS